MVGLKWEGKGSSENREGIFKGGRPRGLKVMKDGKWSFSGTGRELNAFSSAKVKWAKGVERASLALRSQWHK